MLDNINAAVRINRADLCIRIIATTMQNKRSFHMNSALFFVFGGLVRACPKLWQFTFSGCHLCKTSPLPHLFLIQTSETLPAVDFSDMPLVVHNPPTGATTVGTGFIRHVSVFRLQLENQRVVMPFLS